MRQAGPQRGFSVTLHSGPARVPAALLVKEQPKGIGIVVDVPILPNAIERQPMLTRGGGA